MRPLIDREERWWYTPEEAASILRWDAQYIRQTAKKAPQKLPFKVIVHASVTQIPKQSFNEWCTENGISG
ncbi:MAG: hypothetical protein GXZ14_00985 [Ruminococcaceae bacterium]|nr:hypothetical protein [Oscillospiraceae bacterium]